MKLTVAVLALALASTISTPDRAADVSGDVRDPDGRVVPGVTLMLTAADNASRKFTTDKLGAFRITDLAGGTYRLVAQHTGFKTWDSTFTVIEGEALRTTIPLALGVLTELLVVIGEPDRNSPPPVPSGRGRGSAGILPMPMLPKGPQPLPPQLPEPADRRTGGEVVSPKRQTTVSPVYPPGALASGLTAFVFVEATIDADGRIVDPKVNSRSITMPNGDQSKTETGFDESVLNAVARWRYSPARLNGKTVAVTLMATLRFELRRSFTSE